MASVWRAWAAAPDAPSGSAWEAGSAAPAVAVTDPSTAAQQAESSGPSAAAGLLRRVHRDGEPGPGAVRPADEVVDEPEVPAPALYMVLSAAGKLVYVHGDDTAWGGAYTQAGVLHAMLTLFGAREELQHISLAPALHVAFLSRAPLHVVGVTHCAEARALVRARLEHVYAAILSLLSAPRLERLFARAPNVDLMGLIGPMAQYVDAAVEAMHASLARALDAVPVRPLEPALRDALNVALLRALGAQAPQGVLYVQLWDDDRLLSHAHPRHHTPSPTDLALLHAMARCSASEEEGWAPLCLPHAAPHGFVYVYASRLFSGAHAPLFVLVCADRDGLRASRASRDRVREARCVAALPGALAEPVPGALAPVPGLRDVAYASRRRRQCVLPRAMPERRRTLYAHSLQALRGAPPVRATPGAADDARAPPIAAPLQMVVQRTAHEALLGWRTQAFELCMHASPLLSASGLGELANRVVQHMRTHERAMFATAATF
ncbi:Similar to S.cerevisiae protein MON1 (Subunit of a heterodimeric guanine nucleotide exchange factor (GEF)) [Malassezia sympodialis ATCC 42132]|uniref:Vacuolar fusion protein MON1 n=1 Tax=Malassezia sympodialis (strain ATCC 42132) TaxID=1230383 RepID=A0A1M8AB66_MALS4|nr:Similar to S.cerevisiae protein MON1 (Subunit of a heterodimeric guanine nucleotide exchange factor (GEF)) [Malassezia sympodialis ATCC 42132]